MSLCSASVGVRLKRRGLLELAGSAGAARVRAVAGRPPTAGRRPAGVRGAPRGRGLGARRLLRAGVRAAEAHVLRSRLAGLGFGPAAPATRLAAPLYEETRHTRLRLDPYVELFRGEHLGFAATADAVARWWDLAAIAKQHEAFLDQHATRAARLAAARGNTPPEEAYRELIRSPWTSCATSRTV